MGMKPVREAERVTGSVQDAPPTGPQPAPRQDGWPTWLLCGVFRGAFFGYVLLLTAGLSIAYTYGNSECAKRREDAYTLRVRAAKLEDQSKQLAVRRAALDDEQQRIATDIEQLNAATDAAIKEATDRFDRELVEPARAAHAALEQKYQTLETFRAGLQELDRAVSAQFPPERREALLALAREREAVVAHLDYLDTEVVQLSADLMLLQSQLAQLRLSTARDELRLLQHRVEVARTAESPEQPENPPADIVAAAADYDKAVTGLKQIETEIAEVREILDAPNALTPDNWPQIAARLRQLQDHLAPTALATVTSTRAAHAAAVQSENQRRSEVAAALKQRHTRRTPVTRTTPSRLTRPGQTTPPPSQGTRAPAKVRKRLSEDESYLGVTLLDDHAHLGTLQGVKIALPDGNEGFLAHLGSVTYTYQNRRIRVTLVQYDLDDDQADFDFSYE